MKRILREFEKTQRARRSMSLHIKKRRKNVIPKLHKRI